MKIAEIKLDYEEEHDIWYIENTKLETKGKTKIGNNLWCIAGEENIYDGNQHMLLIETEKPVEIMQKLYERTKNKSSHDIIFMPEINLMFDHGHYCTIYTQIENKTLYFIRIYCRPIDCLYLYEEDDSKK